MLNSQDKAWVRRAMKNAEFVDIFPSHLTAVKVAIQARRVYNYAKNLSSPIDTDADYVRMLCRGVADTGMEITPSECVDCINILNTMRERTNEL